MLKDLHHQGKVRHHDQRQEGEKDEQGGANERPLPSCFAAFDRNITRIASTTSEIIFRGEIGLHHFSVTGQLQ